MQPAQERFLPSLYSGRRYAWRSEVKEEGRRPGDIRVTGHPGGLIRSTHSSSPIKTDTGI